jgi:hypothetical protein
LLLPVATAGCHPLAPFVVSENGGGDENESENAEEDLHEKPAYSCQLSVVDSALNDCFTIELSS